MIQGDGVNLREEEKKSEDALKGLLHKLFRSDLEDLDFGIYRIMNFKRDEIKKFIDEDLLGEVENEFKELYDEDKKDLEREIKDFRKKIRDAFGEDALDEEGKLNPLFENTKLGRKYKEGLDALKNVEGVIQDKIEIFSRIHDFFSRYYVDGDLIPIRRYTRSNDYIIPYNGEEVSLYWANKDQYYVKATEYFQKYTFRVSGYGINFKLREAHMDKNNVKGKDKFFILSRENFLDVKDGIVNIYFEYHELTTDDYKKFELGERPNKTTIKEKLIVDAVERINEALKNHPDMVKQLNKPFKKKSGEESEKTLLETHLRTYVNRNTKDYFIHKNLKKFFLTELDFYIKNEMLPMEDIEGMDEATLRKVMRRVRVFKNISTKIIEFLAEIEDFEKMLWEKKKFVLRTEYVITLDKIREYAGEKFLESILDEILSNEKQLNEWKELFGIEVKDRNGLVGDNTLEGKEWKKLPIDTKHFDEEEFKWKLVVALTENNDLDEILDGVLIKSENWQALNLLLDKYYEKVQTIYIDPPFNKEQEADYLYKVNYKDATWVTMLENRIKLGRDLLNERGSIFVRCDYNGNMYVRLLMNEVFGMENFRNEIVVKRMTKLGSTVGSFNIANDSLFLFSKSQNILLESTTRNRICPYCKQPKEPEWVPLEAPGEGKNECIIIEGREFYARKNSHWTFKQDIVDEMYKKELIRINENRTYVDKYENRIKGLPEYLQFPFQTIDDDWTDIPGYARNWSFQTENSEILLKRVIESTSNEGDLILDFFLGSGTTTAVAHKLRRKWIGVEMGEHFWTVVLPRMKKVLFYDKSGISREKDVKEIYNPKTAGGFFKYQYLGQYEDTLNNIIFAGEEGRQAKLLEFKDYIFHILDYGTRGSMSRLNIDQFKKPFDYKMEILENGIPKDTNVDLVETFNYLLGLHIKKIYTEDTNGRKYIWVVGERRDKSLVVVVWRDSEELDLVQDRKYIEDKLNEISVVEPDHIYVNGDSYVQNAIPIETEFMKFVGV